MAIKPVCAKCREELDAYGAIILGPPSRNGTVKKLHLCRKCYNGLIDGWLEA